MSSEYVWTGRGGAGNMISVEELQKRVWHNANTLIITGLFTPRPSERSNREKGRVV